jgi:hypothetical protein
MDAGALAGRKKKGKKAEAKDDGAGGSGGHGASAAAAASAAQGSNAIPAHATATPRSSSVARVSRKREHSSSSASSAPAPDRSVKRRAPSRRRLIVPPALASTFERLVNAQRASAAWESDMWRRYSEEDGIIIDAFITYESNKFLGFGRHNDPEIVAEMIAVDPDGRLRAEAQRGWAPYHETMCINKAHPELVGWHV